MCFVSCSDSMTVCGLFINSVVLFIRYGVRFGGLLVNCSIWFDVCYLVWWFVVD